MGRPVMPGYGARMRLLFIHGAAGYREDLAVAGALAAALGATPHVPRLPGQDMSCAAWEEPIRRHVTALAAGDALVAHSFGASMLLRVLARLGDAAPPRALLLAMPDWGPDGWDVPQYAWDGRAPSTALSLHHCRDDDVVPFAHLALHAARLPGAATHAHATGGHQLDGRVDAIAADVRAGG